MITATKHEIGIMDDEELAANPELIGLKGWYWVCDEEGIYAYFIYKELAEQYIKLKENG
jgi:hypothetical protein